MINLLFYLLPKSKEAYALAKPLILSILTKSFLLVELGLGALGLYGSYAAYLEGKKEAKEKLQELGESNSFRINLPRKAFSNYQLFNKILKWIKKQTRKIVNTLNQYSYDDEGMPEPKIWDFSLEKLALMLIFTCSSAIFFSQVAEGLFSLPSIIPKLIEKPLKLAIGLGNFYPIILYYKEVNQDDHNMQYNGAYKEILSLVALSGGILCYQALKEVRNQFGK